MRPDIQSSATVSQTSDESRPRVTRISRSRCFHSEALFGKEREVQIEHAGFTYRLRITQANKLILTK
ncbi:MAG: hemin uptake protein HemP [Steroidobacteraceae bacterium]